MQVYRHQEQYRKLLSHDYRVTAHSIRNMLTQGWRPWSKQSLRAKSMIHARTHNSTTLAYSPMSIEDHDQEVEQMPLQAQDQLHKGIKMCPKDLRALALAEEVAFINILSHLAKWIKPQITWQWPNWLILQMIRSWHRSTSSRISATTFTRFQIIRLGATKMKKWKKIKR